MSSSPRPFRHVVRSLSVAAALSFCAVVSAKPVPLDQQLDRTEAAPKRLRGVGIKEHLGDIVPQKTAFVDQDGQHLEFGDLFDGKHPVILTLNYSHCPMLCSLELSGLVKALKKVDWTAGNEFRLATIVLDAHETIDQAKQSHARYVKQYGRPEAASGWRFLTGTEAAIHQVADAVGFSFSYNEARNEYLHPASIVLLSPDGRVTRYLYGIEYDPKTLRLSLVEASQGKIGTTIDQIVLYCFHYDEKEGKYAPIAMNIMRVTSGISVALLGGVLTSFWLAESRRKRKQTDSPREGSRSNPS